MSKEFNQGQQTIHREMEATFNQACIHNLSISHVTHGSGATDTAFRVVVNSRSEEVLFTGDEIEDSARALDSFAATKVRMLVSRFSG